MLFSFKERSSERVKASTGRKALKIHVREINLFDLTVLVGGVLGFVTQLSWPLEFRVSKLGKSSINLK